MNINFKTHFPWPSGDTGKPEPTYFKERILNTLTTDIFAGVGRKLHTIRRVPASGKLRFRAGMLLTFSTGPRFKPERFAETNCISTQEVNMWLSTMKGHGAAGPELTVNIGFNGEKKSGWNDYWFTKLLTNDGLSRDNGIKWFALDLLTHGPGEYQIVHWTDLRY